MSMSNSLECWASFFDYRLVEMKSFLSKLPVLSCDGDVELIYMGDGSALTEINQCVN